MLSVFFKFEDCVKARLKEFEDRDGVWPYVISGEKKLEEFDIVAVVWSHRLFWVKTSFNVLGILVIWSGVLVSKTDIDEWTILIGDASTLLAETKCTKYNILKVINLNYTLTHIIPNLNVYKHDKIISI